MQTVNAYILYACVYRGADWGYGDFTLRPEPFCKGRTEVLLNCQIIMMCATAIRQRGARSEG